MFNKLNLIILIGLKNREVYRGKKANDTVYYKDYTYDKSGLQDTMYQAPVKKGETFEQARSRVYKTADSTKRAKW